MEFIIRKLSHEETDVIAAVCQLLNTSYDKRVSEYFIYRDKSYMPYFTKSLADKRDFAYVVFNSSDNALIGYAQVKPLISSIFLNNIIIRPEFRGHNIASKLLSYIIKNFDKGPNNIQTFSLDVFERNSKVLNWYQRLGMKVSGVRYWYDLFDVYNSEKALPTLYANEKRDISVIQDENGFQQVYSHQVHIGTLVANNTLLIRSVPSKEVLFLLKEYFGISLKGICLIADKEFDYTLIDRSLKLEISIEDLECNLDKID
jgi:ribosomal protein S18 acetylase RimI-like enzyme